MFKHALIMAAGRGMRMMPLTKKIPKAMAKFRDSTLIGNAISRIRSDIPDIHITVGYKGADLAKHVIGHGVSGIFNTEGKGNAWWVFNTLVRYIDEPILVLTCDNVVELDLEMIWQDYIKIGKPVCMVVPVKPVQGLDGDFIFKDGNRVIELSRHKTSDMYCSGIQVLNPAQVNLSCRPAESFYEIWNQLIAAGKLYCSTIYPKTWYAVDTIKQLESLNKNKSIQQSG
jgi:MurNAc alpha-1-phosphate uridylyltransferase